MNLVGQRVVLTGGCGGIGSQIAMQLAEQGAVLLLVDRDISRLNSLQQQIEADTGNTTYAISCDLAAKDVLTNLAEQVTKLLGGVDVLINCAGISIFGAFEQGEIEQLDVLWRINVIVPMQLSRLLLPQMLERGYGRIVNIGSIFGSIGFAWFTAYSSSKFAIRGFSEALRRELEGTGVGVTYIAPRYTSTSLNDGAVSHMAQAVGMKSDEPSTVAKHVLRALKQDKKDYYIGWPESFFVRINAILPRLVDKALRKQNVQSKQFVH